jgi:hypothetical protein
VRKIVWAGLAMTDSGSSDVLQGFAFGVGGTTRRERRPDRARNADVARKEEYGGGAAAQPDADGGTACLALIARTGAPRGAAPPHSVTIQAYRNMYKS